ncbi:lysylphosphatidylglycerol synthase transmembrane domain-containing protein [Reichenbachiella sp. MALMAid0571]|uniref:lysylphosphatidylglycerol synthase transmembrane domain-containing protein n=1 Tax=Reichenbachiella sp. MALMAid0571 TaxID=3143939 RepID=UPI0032DF1D7F
MNIKSILKYLIPLVLAIVLLFYAFKNVDYSEFIAKASEVNYMWVIASIAISLISHWLRAYRWNILLSPFGFKLKSGRTFLAVMTGYLANLAFPRIGEVTRCGVLKKNDDVPMSFSFGTVITERIIDFFILLFLILLDFILEFEKVFGFFSETLGFEQIFQNKIFIAFGIGFFLIMAFAGFFLVKYFIKMEIENAFFNKIRTFIKEMMNGLFSLRKIKNVYGFVLSTLGIWVLYYLMSYIIVFSMGETSELGILAGLSILVAGGIAMAIPVQGGIGTYHAFITGILLLYGIQQSTGLFFATLLHASQVFSILFFGGLCVLISVFVSKNKSSNSQKNANGK